MSYNKDTDYQAKIDEAVSKGDYKSAAQYEKSRNEKIDRENLSYKKTNDYQGWLNETDYSDVIKAQISKGASKKDVSDTLKKRVEKASGTKGLVQYAYDDVYDKAVRYIMGKDSYYKEEKPFYQNKYEDKIENLYEKLASMQEFSYDPYSDDVYKYYKSQYNREGKRAMEDLLGELSMNTGGVASSYAVSAASQALDYYNTKLTDKIPELYDDAYKRYADSVTREQKNLEILSDFAESEYDKYIDSLEQYNKESEREYERYLDSLEYDYLDKEMENEKEKEERDYDYLMKKLYAQMSEDEKKWEQQKYENAQKEEERKIEQALKKWSQMGYLDSESAKILGLPAGLKTGDYDYKMKNLAKK